MRDPLEFPSSDVIEDISLRRLKFAAQARIPGPDLQQMLRLEAHMDPNPFLGRYADDLVMRVIGHVYAEDLPPEKVEQTTEVTVEGVAEASWRCPDGPWMRWRERHQTSRWYRVLLGWLPPIRHIHHIERVPWEQTHKVTCRVDLSRFYIYPESRIGAHPGLGSVRVAKHQINAAWFDRPL